jgi:putative NADPH-quinone reductase
MKPFLGCFHRNSPKTAFRFNACDLVATNFSFVGSRLLGRFNAGFIGLMLGGILDSITFVQNMASASPIIANPMKKGIILVGSSNSNGTTMKIASLVSERSGFPIIDLKTKNIGQFDYEFKNKEDDFMPLIRHIVENYETIVFATPVYWYAMSGTMKIFFDRLSDCLKTEKETGRKLRGMEMAVVCCGCDQILKDGFYMPFKETAKYLGMTYMADLYCVEEDGQPIIHQEEVNEFLNGLKNKQSVMAKAQPA